MMIKVMLSLAFLTCIISLACANYTSADKSLPELQNMIEKETSLENSGSVDLIQLPSAVDSLRFEFKNGTERPIYLAYSKETNDDEKSMFMPYYLECRIGKNKQYRPYSPNFDSIPRLTPLQPGKDLVFSIARPNVRGECIISVSYYSDERAVRLVREKLQNLSSDEEVFVEKSQRNSELQFRIE
jgi:hypothetical protein